MAKVTYKPRSSEDPDKTTTQGVTFEKGKAVDVSDQVAEKLANNPYFEVSGSKAKAKATGDLAGMSKTARSAADARDAGGPVGPVVSLAQQPNYPPGVGEKTAPPTVMTQEGETLPAVEGTRKAGELADKKAEGKAKRTAKAKSKSRGKK